MKQPTLCICRLINPRNLSCLLKPWNFLAVQLTDILLLFFYSLNSASFHGVWIVFCVTYWRLDSKRKPGVFCHFELDKWNNKQQNRHLLKQVFSPLIRYVVLLPGICLVKCMCGQLARKWWKNNDFLVATTGILFQTAHMWKKFLMWYNNVH